MEKGKNRNAVLLTVIGIATLLVAIVGATFAYFSAQVTYNDGSSTLTIVSATGGSSTYQGGEEITVQNIYPRADAWVQKAIKITYSNSTTTANYNYNLAINFANTFTTGYLSYEFKPIPYNASTGVCLSNGALDSNDCPDSLIVSTNNGSQVATKTGSFDNTSGAANSINLGNGYFAPTSGSDVASHVYLLTIWFLNGSGNQNDAQGKALTASVGYSEVHA